MSKAQHTQERVATVEPSSSHPVVGTWEWDPISNSSHLSPELYRMFGTNAGDPEHVQKWASRVFPADWEKVQRCMKEGAESGNMDFEYRYQQPEMGLRWFYCKGTRMHDASRMFGLVMT